MSELTREDIVAIAREAAVERADSRLKAYMHINGIDTVSFVDAFRRAVIVEAPGLLVGWDGSCEYGRAVHSAVAKSIQSLFAMDGQGTDQRGAISYIDRHIEAVIERVLQAREDSRRPQPAVIRGRLGEPRPAGRVAQDTPLFRAEWRVKVLARYNYGNDNWEGLSGAWDEVNEKCDQARLGWRLERIGDRDPASSNRQWTEWWAVISTRQVLDNIVRAEREGTGPFTASIQLNTNDSVDVQFMLPTS